MEYIEIEHINDVWEFAVWRGETQIALGHRPTLSEAQKAAEDWLDPTKRICKGPTPICHQEPPCRVDSCYYADDSVHPNREATMGRCGSTSPITREMFQAADKARTAFLRDVDCNDQESALFVALEAAWNAQNINNNKE